MKKIEKLLKKITLPEETILKTIPKRSLIDTTVEITEKYNQLLTYTNQLQENIDKVRKLIYVDKEILLYKRSILTAKEVLDELNEFLAILILGDKE